MAARRVPVGRQPDHLGHASQERLRFGGGGVGGWGTLCGTCNGSAAIIALASARRGSQQDHRRAHAVLRRDADADQRYRQGSRGGWTPTAGARLRCRTFLPPPPIPSCATRPSPVDDDHRQARRQRGAEGPLRQGLLRHGPQDDRCCSTRTSANNANVVPAGALDPTIAPCQAACHSSAKGRWRAIRAMTRPAPAPTTTDLRNDRMTRSAA